MDGQEERPLRTFLVFVRGRRGIVIARGDAAVEITKRFGAQLATEIAKTFDAIDR